VTHLATGLLFSVLAGVANLIGGLALTAKSRWDERFLHATLALGSGFMLAAAVLKMIPASLEANSDWIPVLILGGYLLVQAAEHTVTPHFHFGEETHREVMVGSRVGVSALIGLMVHTFFDGVSIGAGFAVSWALGLLIFLAVILHKMPEGFTMASIVLASGGPRRLALGASGLIGLATVVGALLTGTLAAHHVRYALAISAGVTLYVAASDLVPEVNNAHGINSSLLLFAGVALFWATERLLHLLGVP
jgi:ZIP family zinc transporter/zinc and cadmium transporter